MAETGKLELKALTRELKSIKAKDIMTKGVITTTEDSTLADVAKIMIKVRISNIPVVGKKGQIVGIITTNDLFLVMDMIKSGDVPEEDLKKFANPTVKYAMSTEVIKIKKNTSLDEIINIMTYKNAQDLLVFVGNKMVGIVGRRDVFKNFYTAIKKLYL